MEFKSLCHWYGLDFILFQVFLNYVFFVSIEIHKEKAEKLEKPEKKIQTKGISFILYWYCCYSCLFLLPWFSCSSSFSFFSSSPFSSSFSPFPSSTFFSLPLPPLHTPFEEVPIIFWYIHMGAKIFSWLRIFTFKFLVLFTSILSSEVKFQVWVSE